jgi:uncharacterized protein (TIGR02680 family)
MTDAAHLSERFKPVRAGLLNLFEYGDQVFEFADGHLLLRGHNGAGKSKALELLLPFVLDGDTHPTKLDPFGGPGREMKWNLTLGGRYESRWGYAWLEFGRQRPGQEPEWVTLAVGVRAHHQTPGATTWFLVIPDGRVGHDVSLINPQSKTPLLRRGIRDALGADVEVFDEAYAYRERVNELLFGFPTVERYETMLELQRQLRRPHLSRGLDPEKLSDILTRALPEVDHRLIGDIGAHLDAIEQLRQDLRALTAVRDGFRTFLDTYQAYARAVVAERAGEVLGADREARRARGELASKRRAAEAAKQEAGRLERKVASLDRELETNRGAEQELLRSDGVRSANELAELREQVRTLGVELQELADGIAAAEREAAGERAEAESFQSKQSSEEKLAEAVDDAMRTLAATTGLEHHDTLAEQLRSNERPETAAKTMRESVAQRRTDIARQRDLRAAAERADQEATVRDEAATRAEGRVRDCEDRLAVCEGELATQRQTLVDSAQAWVEQLNVLVLSDEQTEALLDTANASGDPAVSLRAAVVEPAQAHEAAWVRAELQLQADQQRVAAERAPLEDERQELEAMRTPEPPSVYTRSTERAGRTGAPLWRLVDFDDSVPDEHRAGLEAALEGSGLLDAWVLPDGSLLDIADDVALAASAPAPGRRLGELLRPVGEAVPHAVTAGVLAAIGLGDTRAADGGVRVDVDGSFRAGPAGGRYAKEAAQYIGAAARERNRARRLAELAALLAELDEGEAELDRALAALADKRSALHAELARLPDESAVRSAFAAVRDIDRQLATLRPDAAQARTDADDAATSAANARRAAIDHAHTHRLPVPGEQPSLEGLESALSDYGARIGELVLHTSTAAQHASQAAAAEARAARTDARASGLREQHARRDARLQRQRGALQALEETKGADADDALARLEQLQADIASLSEQAKTAAADKEHAAVAHAKLETAIATAEREVSERKQTLNGKLVRFRALEEPDFLRLAVADGAPSPGTLQSWQAGHVQQFTRDNSDALRPVDSVENLTNLVESGYTRLLAELDGSVGVQPFRQRHDGLDIVAATRGGRQVSMRVLMTSLDEEIAAQQRNLTEQDQRTFERFLFNGIAQELRTRINAAQLLVEDTNDAIARCQTSSGMSVELSWEPNADDDPLLRRALQLLRSAPEALSGDQREQLIRFFRERVEAARLAQDEGTATQHLLDALDYRQWHRFRVLQTKDGVKVQLTKKQHDAGSGGEKAAALHLPLFAAAAAQMRSAGPQAPRLVMLDEAFAGIDNNMRPQLLGLMETFDLDFMLTSHELWCCERELEHLSIYQLHREDGVPGVGCVHFLWSGATGALTEVDDEPVVAA